MLETVPLRAVTDSPQFGSPSGLFWMPPPAIVGNYSYDLAGRGQRFLALALWETARFHLRATLRSPDDVW